MALPLEDLAATDNTVFLELCRSLRLVCPRCDGRKMHIVPLWPDVRQKRAASMGADIRPVMPETVSGFGMLGAGEPPPA